MNFTEMLQQGPVLATKPDLRHIIDFDQQAKDILAALPGTRIQVAKRSGWGLKTVLRVLHEQVERGTVREIKTTTKRGGRSFRYEAA